VRLVFSRQEKAPETNLPEAKAWRKARRETKTANKNWKKTAEEGNGHANAHKTTNGHLMEWMTVIFAGSRLLDENFGLVDDNRI